MYVLRSHVFSKQEKEFVEKVVAGTGNITAIQFVTNQHVLLSTMRKCHQFTISIKELLLRLHIKLSRSKRSKLSTISCPRRQIKRSSIRNTVASYRMRWHCHRQYKYQQQSKSSSDGSTKVSNGLCTGTKRFNCRRRTSNNCMSHVAMVRFKLPRRYSKNTTMSKCKRSNLCLLQSSTLESHLQNR